ncbi:hypothetical protein U5A82_03430 [Sphingobium sp. CR2-8]|uniref:hypothetical protein n=1 Tax=Sphingobium sp. CR2-8 TaxID=1306534 RepID=UPI002DB79140|nr:hypothetical protein [Sphingobium sp. CR2-8]MEC3909555.1 hypothetical protein [Sphingobium sp. CR2-8]
MKRSKSGALSMVNPRAAAIDIGSTMHMAAINPNADDDPVRAFGTFTGDLQDMRDAGGGYRRDQHLDIADGLIFS